MLRARQNGLGSGSGLPRHQQTGSGRRRRNGGACRITRDTGGLIVTPLPNSPEFTVRIDWPKLPWDLPAPARVQAIGMDGAVLSADPVQKDGGTVVLTCQQGVFEYRLKQ